MSAVTADQHVKGYNIWTGQTSKDIGSAALNVPAATNMSASLSSSTSGITFLDASGVAPLPNNLVTFSAPGSSSAFSIAVSTSASPGVANLIATPSNFGSGTPPATIVEISADQIVLLVTNTSPSTFPNVVSVITGQPFTATVYVRATAGGPVTLSASSPGNAVSVNLPSTVTINPAPGDSGSGVSQPLSLIIRGFAGSVALTAKQGSSNPATVHIQVSRASPTPPIRNPV